MNQKASYFTLGFLIGGLCATLALSCWIHSGGNSHRKVLKLAHGLETTHPVHIGMEFMKKRLEELSGGKLSVDIYSGGALGSEIKCLEQLKNGSLDMTKASCAQIGTFVPQMHALCMPYVFRDSGHYWRVLDSDLGRNFLGFMRMDGLMGLCFYDAGARCFYTSKKQIHSPEDLRGMKIRVMNSRADMDMISAFGASPTPISAGETYTALAQGIVDGAENNLPTYYTSAHFEVAKNCTIDEHTSIPDVLIIGERSWNSLPENERKMLAQAADESSRFQRELWREKTGEAKKALLGKGVNFIEVDKSEFRKVAESIYRHYDGTDIGGLIKKIRGIE